jgi:hypothetical protein
MDTPTITKYVHLMRYRNCPICNRVISRVEYSQDGNKLLRFFCNRYHRDKFSHYHQEINRDDGSYYWLVQYDHNDAIYSIENFVDGRGKCSIVYYTSVNEPTDPPLPMWDWTLNRDCGDMSKEEVIELIDRLMVLS